MKPGLRVFCLLGVLYSAMAVAEDIDTLSNTSLSTTSNPSLSLTTAEKVWLSKQKIISVGGSPDWTPFNFVDESGRYAGIANDYLNLIAQKTGLKFEVSIDQWSHNLQKVRDKQIDLLPAVYYTDERSQYLTYSKPYFEMLDYFFVHEDLNVKTLKDLNGKRVAIPKKYAHENLLKKHFPKIQIVTVNTFTDAVEAVLEGRADILYDTYGSLTYTLKKEGINTIIPFKSTRHLGKNAIHIVTRNDAPELAEIIQKGLNAITDQEKQVINHRWLGYKSEVEKPGLELTVEEQQWLRDHPVIRLGVESNWPPYEFIGQTGELQGLSADVIQLVEQRLAIQFKIISQYSWAETLDKARTHEIDMVSSIVKTPEREQYLSFTKSYVSPPSVIFTRKDNVFIHGLNDLKHKTVSVENQYYTHKRLISDFPEINVLPFGTTIDALKALSFGKADAYVGNQGVANWVTEQNSLTNLKVVNDAGLGVAELSLAVRKDWVVFQRILDKSFTSISDAELSSIRRKWLGIDSDSKKLVLSTSERQWLNQHKTIRFTGDPNWLPYEAFDKQGNYIGIVAEHLKLIEGKLGINIDIIPTQSWSESVAKVKRGEIDVLSETSDSDLTSQLTFTQSYVTSPVVIVMRSDELYIENINQIKQRKIAVIKDYGYVPEIIKNYPDLNLYHVDTLQDGLLAVSTGKADALFATLAQASYHISDLAINNIRIVGKTEFKTKLAFGMRQEFAPLVPLFNRAIVSISPNEKQRILDMWGKHKFAVRTDYSLLAKSAGIFLLIIAVIVYWNRKLNKEIIHRKEIEAQTQALIDTIPLQIIITNYNGNVLYANPKALFDYNIEKNTINNLNISSFYHDMNDRERIINELSMRGKVDQIIVPFNKQNGDTCSMMLSIMPIKYSNEKAYLTIAVDMTERLQLEEALKTSKETAESASRFKSQFLANMSHEIRTPMNAVIGMSHLALNTNLDDKQRDYIEKIKISGQTLMAIINDILDFSKIEAGKLEIENTAFLLDSVLENLVSMVALKAEEKNLELIFKRDTNITNTLIGDPLRISQILLNLAQNAIKFTDSGEIIISVSLLKRKNDRQMLEFTVSDTGIGIDEDQLIHMFDAFVQADSSTTRRYGGTGLGLSISQQLVTLMGGQLKATSELSIGSTFSFTLDLTVQQDSLQQTLDPTVGLKELRVLVVDDNKVALQVLTEMLASFSFDVSAVTSADQAYTLLSKANCKEPSQLRPFDLVLVDMQMPDINGIDAIRHIRNNLQLQKQPLILLIATYGQEDITWQAGKNDLDGFLMKPATPSTLFDTINELFHKHGTRRVKKQSVQRCFKGKVLLVEDNTINQQVASEMLENFGLLVVIADSGEKAIQRVQQSEYDLVFMDVQMSGIDGLETTRQIRKKLHNSHLPIIAMTAHAMTGDKERCLDAGMNDYLSKPIDPESLYQILKHWLKVVDSGIENHVKTINQNRLPVNESINLHTDLTGINLQQGLSRVGHNLPLYLKLLQDFIDKYEQTPQTLNQFLISDNLQETNRLMHTLSGVAGTIGAETLQNKVFDMLSLLQNDATLEPEVWEAFYNNFNELMLSLKTWLNGQNKINNKALDKAPIEHIKLDDTILTQIIQLVKEGKPEAAKILSRINLQELDSDKAELIFLVLSHVRNYNFIDALSSLSKLKI